MSEEVKQEQQSTGWYRFARFVGAIVMNTICPTKYHDLERINDREGPFIIIANHNSMLDPVAIAYRVKRDVTFLGKKELTKNKLVAKALTGMHMIVVDRHNSDMKAMRACVGALRKGNILGIFPEGTRHHAGLMNELESGVAMMALMSNAPMVPVLISNRIRPFHKTDVYVGEPIDFADLRAEGVNNESCAKLLERIRERYAEWGKTCWKP